MGGEVRRVPADWKHPLDETGHYRELMPDYARRLLRWQEEKDQWDQGLQRAGRGGWKPITPDQPFGGFDDVVGEKPDPEQYMPEWPEEAKTHMQMYETSTEGTPISPVMEKAEELAQWLVDNEASAFAGDTASYEGWLATIHQGFAPAMMHSGGKFYCGVEAMSWDQRDSPA